MYADIGGSDAFSRNTFLKIKNRIILYKIMNMSRLFVLWKCNKMICLARFRNAFPYEIGLNILVIAFNFSKNICLYRPKYFNPNLFIALNFIFSTALKENVLPFVLNWFFCFHCQKFMTKFATFYSHRVNTEILL